MVKYGYIINPAIYKQDSRDILWSQKKGDGTTVLCVETTREADSNLHLFDTKQDFIDWRGEQPEEPTINCTRCGNEFNEADLMNGLCINCEASESQSGERKKRRGIIDRLVTATEGTQLQDVVMALRLHYAAQTAIFEETGNAQPMLDAIEGEADETISSYLAIEFTNASNITQTLENWIVNELQS
jgi:ribosomal protein L30/L7E